MFVVDGTAKAPFKKNLFSWSSCTRNIPELNFLPPTAVTRWGHTSTVLGWTDDIGSKGNRLGRAMTTSSGPIKNEKGSEKSF